MPIIDIKEGNTSTYVIPAVALLIAGGITTVFIPFIGLPILAIGISLFFVGSGVEIDTAGCRFRKYANYFGMKIGPWHKLTPCVQVVLQLSVESQSINTYFLPGRTGSMTGKTTFKSIT